MSPPLYQRLVDTLMSEFGYDYDATPDIIEKFDLMFDPGNIELVPQGPFNDDQFATGGRVGFSEGSGPDMDRVLELEEQGFSYEEAFEKAMQERLDRGYAAGGAVESMNFLKQHLPYQDGGHVALRRKMFKLGGPVNTHGIGITSGLEYRNNYNAGGSVRQKFGKGSIVLDLLTGGASNIGRRARDLKKLYDKYKKTDAPKDVPYLGMADEAGEGIMKAYKEALKRAPFKTLGSTAGTGAILGSVPYGLARYGQDMSGETRETYGDTADDLLTEISRTPINMTIGAIPTIKDILASESGSEAYDALLGQGDSYKKFYETLYGGPQFSLDDSPGGLDDSGVVSKTNMTREQLSARNQEENQARMQQAMEQYAELLAGSDDTNKLATLGDALIAGGSALMEGEGYGAAGRAFNEPLSGARRSKEERMAAANQAAAQLAISENMQIDAEKRAVVNEFMKTASYSDAEANELYNLALDAGVQRLVPEDDGELDVATLEQNPGVYADPKNLSTKGTLFLAVNSKNEIMPTNDPEEAKAHAAS